MIVDLHAHYPMHLLPEARGSLWQLLRTPLGRARLRDRARALLVGLASRFINYRSLWSGPRVTIDSLQRGEVRVPLSVITSFFDELALGEPYPAKPKASYLAPLLRNIEFVEEEIRERHAQAAVVVHSPGELQRALDDGKVALVHCVEGGYHLGGTPAEVDHAVTELARRGVAYITVAHLVWRHVATNAPAIPFLPDWLYRRLFPQPDLGLSELGEAAVRAMVREGVLIDLTHMSDRAVADTFALLDRLDGERRVPVLATHGCFRFGSQEYGLSEQSVRRVAERDGAVGLIMAQHQLNSGVRATRSWRFRQSLEVICAHIDRIGEITGSHRHTAIGSDFDGFIKPTVAGLESAGDMQRLEGALRERYGDADGERICSGNALRVLNAGWAGAASPSATA
jgi:microsomal dipeptidase-like Zn-dependent dipeptidase